MSIFTVTLVTSCPLCMYSLIKFFLVSPPVRHACNTSSVQRCGLFVRRRTVCMAAAASFAACFLALEQEILRACQAFGLIILRQKHSCVCVCKYIHTHIYIIYVCVCMYVYTYREKHTYMFVVMRIKENIGLQGFGLGIFRSQGAYIYRSRHLIITITSRVALLERGAPEELGGRCWDGGLGRSFWGRRVWKARGCLGRRGR